jgi:WD40 repeat protein
MFMPADPRRVLTAADERPQAPGPATLWSWRDGNALRRFGSMDGEATTALSVDAAGSRVVTADGAYDPVVWNASTGRGTRLGRDAAAVHTVALSARGNRLAAASGDDSVRLWDLDRRRVLREFESGPVAGLAFAAGDRMVLAHTRSRVRIFAADDGALVGEFRRPGEPLWQAALSPDGRRVAATGADLVVRVYDCPACVERGDGALRERVEAQAGRELGDAEVDRYLEEARR